MQEGFWIRIKDDKVFDVYDHAGDFAQSPSLAKKMGIQKLYNELIVKQNLKPEGPEGKIRTKIVLAIMKEGFIRARGHGSYTTFEFTDSASQALDSIYMFGREELGDYSELLIVQLNDKGKVIDSADLTWADFEERYDEDKSKILKTARIRLTKRCRK